MTRSNKLVSALSDSHPRQVSKAATARKPKPEKSEPVKPKSLEDQIRERMHDWLKAAANTRTSTLKLANLEFAAELRKQLLATAVSMEGMYQEVMKALDSKKKPSEKEMGQMLHHLDHLEKKNEKLQAGG